MENIVDSLRKDFGSCTFYDDLPVTSYSFTKKITDFTYMLTSGMNQKKFWETSNALCYDEVYSLTFKKDG